MQSGLRWRRSPSRRRFPFASRPTRRRPVALVVCLHRGIGQLLRKYSSQWPAASHHQLAPAHPTGASPLRGFGPRAPVCPSAPQGGALSPAPATSELVSLGLQTGRVLGLVLAQC